MFLVTYDGDIKGGRDRWYSTGTYGLKIEPWYAEDRVFRTLQEALEGISRDFPVTDGVRETPDPEDDRIVVWSIDVGYKLLPSWAFCGWHWSCDDLGLTQGTLPGDSKSLYDLAMEDHQCWK